MKPLPRHLQQAVATLSVTVQELVFEVALCATGMPSELPPKPDSGVEGAWRRNHPTPERNQELRDYMYNQAPTDFLHSLCVQPLRVIGPAFIDRCAIGVAAAAGRSAPEIDRFFGWDGLARYRLKDLRRIVSGKTPRKKYILTEQDQLMLPFRPIT